MIYLLVWEAFTEDEKLTQTIALLGETIVVGNACTHCIVANEAGPRGRERLLLLAMLQGAENGCLQWDGEATREAQVRNWSV